MHGPKTVAADSLHAVKYRQPGEDFREAVNRWSFALKDDDAHYHVLRDVFGDMRFLPPGRTQSAIGALGRETTAYNCFVSRRIADSFVHGEGSIMDTAKEAAATMRMGGGIGYDFSSLRPRGDAIRKLQSTSSGPVSFMRLFNEVGLATASSGHRRGAQMAVMRVDHPDINEFVAAKQPTSAQRTLWQVVAELPRDHLLRQSAEAALQETLPLQGFNISVGVTDEFMEAVYAGKEFELRFGDVGYRSVDAAELWEKVMRSTWDWSEPGVLFLDRINEMNNLWYCETIAATNPCGEQPLPPFGACLLGSFNLVRYLDVKTAPTSTMPRWSFDLDQLRADVAPIIRAMDNVVDRTRYPLARQRGEATSKRRMGIGVTGLANAGEALGHPYGSSGFIEFTKAVLTVIRDESYRASAMLAKEKGSFPLYDEERYLAGRFIATLPEDVRDLIKRHGVRNSHLTSIAPTGTISMAADNVSSGLEPVIYHSALRRINTPTGSQEVVVDDYGVAFLGVRGRISEEVSPREHVDVLCAASLLVDSAVSKTCNVDGTVPWADFKDLYAMGHRGGAKGLTTYNKDGSRGSIMRAAPEAAGEGDSCEVGPDGRRNCA